MSLSRQKWNGIQWSVMEMIDIKNLDKAEILAALFNGSQPLGRGFLHPQCDVQINREDAAKYLSVTTKFDYLNGRVLKIDLSGDSFDPRLYDRDNGTGAAEMIVNSIRNKSGTIQPSPSCM